jgi:hypothetical protein
MRRVRHIVRQPETLRMALIDSLRKRIGELDRWLAGKCPECPVEQAHMVAGSREQKYWNYGYLMALRNVMARMKREDRM